MPNEFEQLLAAHFHLAYNPYPLIAMLLDFEKKEAIDLNLLSSLKLATKKVKFEAKEKETIKVCGKDVRHSKLIFEMIRQKPIGLLKIAN